MPAHSLPQQHTADTTIFSAIVQRQWQADPSEVNFTSSRQTEQADPETYRIIIDHTLPASRRLMLIAPQCGLPNVRLLPELAQRLGLHSGQHVAAAQLQTLLEAASLQLNGADDLFYFPLTEQQRLRTETTSDVIRTLSADDSAALAEFQAQLPQAEWEEAFVELDHWLVYGLFVDDKLACAASLLRWANSGLADLGVCTLPALRGRGHARRTVRAISAAALQRGHEPQYRCQPDNHASVALARSAGLQRYARWDVLCA